MQKVVGSIPISCFASSPPGQGFCGLGLLGRSPAGASLLAVVGRPTSGAGDRSDRHALGVPAISSFFGITIAMYYDDHGHPHFHARHAGNQAKVRIDELEVIESSLGRRQLRFVLAWAELHQDELADNWSRARLGETLREIEPLQ